MVIVLMGVAGAGKTTVGKLLADSLGWKFVDADSLHSSQNIAKMHAGIALTDEDRLPWLSALQSAVREWVAKDENVVLACSALKQSYRNMLLIGPQVKLVFLHGQESLIAARLAARAGHFAGPRLLRSQLQTLEEPKDAVVVEVAAPPEAIVMQIRRELRLAS